MKTIISIIDGNPINQTALKIMLKGLKLNHQPRVDIYVLCPSYVLTEKIGTWLEAQGIGLYPYPIEPNGDPYQVKFLLSYFLRDHTDLQEALYIDPDHIILGAVCLKPQPNTLYVSSESAQLNINALHNLYSNLDKNTHHNTSLIYGNTRDWLSIFDGWLHTYVQIHDLIPDRFREEIAFSLAASPAGIKLAPVGGEIQSGFHATHDNCTFFHYGGEYQETKRIKHCMKNEATMLKQLNELLQNPISPNEAWALNEIIKIWRNIE